MTKDNRALCGYVIFGLILLAAGLALPSIDANAPFWFCMLLSCSGSFVSTYALALEYELRKHNKAKS